METQYTRMAANLDNTHKVLNFTHEAMTYRYHYYVCFLNCFLLLIVFLFF